MKKLLLLSIVCLALFSQSFAQTDSTATEAKEKPKQKITKKVFATSKDRKSVV